MKQQITNFGKFYSLLKLMPGVADAEETKRQLVWRFTDLRTDSLKEIRKLEYGRMIEHMEDTIGPAEPQRKRQGYYDTKTENLRRNTIGVVFAYFRMIREPKDIAYVKRIICRAGQATNINQISPVQMQRIYGDWCKRVKVRSVNDEIVQEELIKAGYLEKGDEQ